jgi:hypothetical protein
MSECIWHHVKAPETYLLRDLLRIQSVDADDLVTAVDFCEPSLSMRSTSERIQTHHTILATLPTCPFATVARQTRLRDFSAPR